MTCRQLFDTSTRVVGSSRTNPICTLGYFPNNCMSIHNNEKDNVPERVLLQHHRLFIKSMNSPRLQIAQAADRYTFPMCVKRLGLHNVWSCI